MASKPTTPKNNNSNGSYAIVETSGSQFWLEPNRYYDLDRIKAEVDEKITLDKILLFNDGKNTKIGRPYIPGASVELKVMAHRRGPKILVYKMRPKKKTRRKNGHRQELTRVMVESISIRDKAQKTEKVTKASKKTVKETPDSKKETKAPAKAKTNLQSKKK